MTPLANLITSFEHCCCVVLYLFLRNFYTKNAFVYHKQFLKDNESALNELLLSTHPSLIRALFRQETLPSSSLPVNQPLTVYHLLQVSVKILLLLINHFDQFRSLIVVLIGRFGQNRLVISIHHFVQGNSVLNPKQLFSWQATNTLAEKGITFIIILLLITILPCMVLRQCYNE